MYNRRCDRSVPVLTTKNLHHEAVPVGLVPNASFVEEFVSDFVQLLPELLQHTIVRRLSQRAGIFRMTNEAYE